MWVPRTRGTVSGILLVLLGAWGALIPFVGSYVGLSFTPDGAWTWTAGRGWLEVLPGAAAALAVALWLLLDRTRLGAMIRAGVDDPDMARVVGIPVPWLFTIVFCLGAALAGFAGVIGAPILSVYPGLDQEMLPLALVVVILGGSGSLLGSLVGSLVVGVLAILALSLLQGPLITATHARAVVHLSHHPSIGFLPALIGLTLYSVLPILRNTVTGIRGDADDLYRKLQHVIAPLFYDDPAAWTRRHVPDGCFYIAGTMYRGRASNHSKLAASSLEGLQKILAGSGRSARLEQSDCVRNSRRSFLEQLDPLATHPIFEIYESGEIATWPRQAMNEAGTDRVGRGHEHD
jgi:hypothetical protein